jgi:hypothetical protein
VTLTIDSAGSFDGVVPFVPPSAVTSAVLVVSATDEPDVELEAVTFPVAAGSLLLVRDVGRLRGRPGDVLVLDVLVYGAVSRVRGLLTASDGVLIASAERRLIFGSREDVALDPPRTVALEFTIPATGVPPRGTLHLLGLDADGVEVEHIDASVLFGR